MTTTWKPHEKHGTLDTEDRQLLYIFPQFSLNDTGTIEATVESVHYYVVQPAQ
jgi:hypothetical protein